MACYDSKNPNCGCCPPPPPMPTCCFQGPPGVTGAVGATGATGATGMAATVQVGTTTTGAPGTNASIINTGTDSNAVLNFVIPAGATGANGADGTAATVQIGTTTTSAPGTNASVTNTGTENNAVLNFVIPAGATGANGADGATGADGTAATVQVGTTTTGAPGTDASVTNTGTESNAVLNFVIPAGATGATGADGATGANGTAATVQVGSTTTGAPGTNASVTNTGTESNAVLNFVIPAGATGATGANGAAGTAATVQIGTTTTGAPGKDASVTNTGTESNAVLNFVIPAGATGANGADGATGADGTAATVQVGTTITGAPGTNASVTNTGTESDAVLNFVIPAGATGAAGVAGTAATVQVGTTTTGTPGTNASVTNTGTESNAVLNFVIPAGATGASAAESRPSVLAVQDTTEQALTENTPVSFAVNLLQSGTDLTHAAGSNQITVETPGIYQAAFTAEVSPTGTATLPLTISLSLEQGTTILETSSTTMTTAEQSNTLAWNIPFTVTAAPEVLQILSDGTDVILNRATLTINKIGTV